MLEQALLNLLARRRGKHDLYLVKTVLLASGNFSDVVIDRILALAQKNGWIRITEEPNPLFEKCIEANKDSKRIKNVFVYCRERYPTLMWIEITEEGLIRYLHNVYCLTLWVEGKKETAMLNFRYASRSVDYYTVPPEVCGK